MNALDFFHLEGTGRLPTIFKHTDEQLDTAISDAVARCPDFYVLLHGIDAYMERRRRRMKAVNRYRNAGLAEFVDNEHMWGQS